MNIVQKAKIFATASHAAIGQKRRYTGEDYIIHPARVVIILSTITDDEEILAAGWLHDVVEDTKVDLDLIEQQFGTRICKLVDEVTDRSKPEDGNREFRKEIDRRHLADSSARGATIKLADILDNTNCIVRNDPKFAVVYFQEKRAMLPILRHGNAILFDLAQRQVDDYFSGK